VNAFRRALVCVLASSTLIGTAPRLCASTARVCSASIVARPLDIVSVDAAAFTPVYFEMAQLAASRFEAAQAQAGPFDATQVEATYFKTEALDVQRERPSSANNGDPRAKGDTGAAQKTPQAEPASTGDTHLAIRDERARAALERGLDWLAHAQATETDGSFPAIGLRTRGASEVAFDGAGQFAPVAITALSALAFMSGGSAPDRGPHGRETALAVDWLVARTELGAGSERRGYIARSGDSLSRMHGHGFATLALAQAYAMSPKSPRGAKIAVALDAAIACIEASQSVDGGWYYEPKAGLQHENSITICVVQALRAAHNAGLKVSPRTIARAVDYVKRTQKPDGSFRYALGDEKSSVALTAAAIATLNATGTYDGKIVHEGYDWIFRKLADRTSHDPSELPKGDFMICPFYERLYVAESFWQHPDTSVFDNWWRSEIAHVLTTQAKDGSWHDASYGDCYATAMNCLVLALPQGLLPIFQR